MNPKLITVAAVLTLVGCSVSTPPATPTVSAPAAQKITLNVGAFGADQISYTDPTAPGGVRTEQLPGFMTPVSHKITVDKGTTVAVALSGYADRPVTQCTITDETDRLVYVRGKDSCMFVAR
ncbi:hypothetical protein [Amycolatopsis nalaikhensis]|uniref:Lipoprotein n=1 Tax=Amycolatopsis nalaikhensis TaxID=715472 RepID=A0ABY8Y0N8_9PSEU|nr:hypothetical protein [Amycolatopsis sp. 2-2]WIV61428.1 hypothetical protein QP939_23880 [Amycolatopsis sp. 2-2]